MLYLLPALLGRPLSETPEARVAVVAREMLQSGDWVVPTLGGERRDFKPPLAYWLTAAAAKLLAGNAAPDVPDLTRAVLLVSACCAALSVFVTVLCASFFFGPAAGILSGLILGPCFWVLRFAELGYPDTALMCACALMLYGAAALALPPRPSLAAALAFGVGLGLGVLVKEPIPFLVLGGPLAVEVLVRRKWDTRKALLFALGAALAALVALPWFVLLAQRTPGGWEGLLLERQVMWQAGHVQGHRWSFYVYKLAAGLLPWTPVLLCAWPLYWAWGRKEVAEAARAPLRFFGLAFALGFLMLYASPKQQDHYLLPVLPPLAIASAFVLSRFRNAGGRKEEVLGWSQLALGLACGLALLTAPLWVSPKGADGELPWAVCVPAGTLFGALFLYCARQWVEGRPTRAVGALAAAAFAAGLAWSVYYAYRTRETTTLAAEASRLKAELALGGPELRAYAFGCPLPLAVFYLERPVLTLADLMREPRKQVGPSAPRRALVVPRGVLEGSRSGIVNAWGLPTVPSGDHAYQVVWLSRDEDWPARARQARAVWAWSRGKDDD